MHHEIGAFTAHRLDPWIADKEMPMAPSDIFSIPVSDLDPIPASHALPSARSDTSWGFSPANYRGEISPAKCGEDSPEYFKF
jgi:hypothetical protein